jgi:hypothetical protein
MGAEVMLLRRCVEEAAVWFSRVAGIVIGLAFALVALHGVEHWWPR